MDPDYDSAAEDYDSARTVPSETISRLRSRLSSLPGGSILLSLGCGTGHHEEELARTGIHVLGLDPSCGMLARARTRGLRVVQASATDIPIRTGAIGAILMNQSFHHVGGSLGLRSSARLSIRRSAIAECARVAREGAPLIIVQSSPDQNAAVWFWRYYPEALRRKLAIQPSVPMIQELLEEGGYGAVEASPYHGEIMSRFHEPTAPLAGGFKRSFSEFAYLSPGETRSGDARLTSAARDGSALAAIDECRKRFVDLGGNLTMITARRGK